MLTHGAIASTVASVSQFLRRHHSTALNPRDVYYSFLPLGHIFDRQVWVGGQQVSRWSVAHMLTSQKTALQDWRQTSESAAAG